MDTREGSRIQIPSVRVPSRAFLNNHKTSFPVILTLSHHGVNHFRRKIYIVLNILSVISKRFDFFMTCLLCELLGSISNLQLLKTVCRTFDV